ncbi:hypothetical protein ACNOYE_33380 [Nannocystaceae bacterium ST9]
MSIFLLALLLSPPAADDAGPPASESAPTETSTPAETSTTEPAPEPSRRAGPEFLLHVAPGANLIVGRFTAYGPSFRLGAWGSSWFGHFMIGGGATLHYSYLLEPKPADDHLHFFTLQGDMVLGGGTYEKFAIYAHLTAGAGVLSAKDGATGSKFVLPGIRAAAGIGGYGYITPRVSLGALVDFGYFGTLGLDLLLTVNIHFGRGTKA